MTCIVYITERPVIFRTRHYKCVAVAKVINKRKSESKANFSVNQICFLGCAEEIGEYNMHFLSFSSSYFLFSFKWMILWHA